MNNPELADQRGHLLADITPPPGRAVRLLAPVLLSAPNPTAPADAPQSAPIFLGV